MSDWTTASSVLVAMLSAKHHFANIYVSNLSCLKKKKKRSLPSSPASPQLVLGCFEKTHENMCETHVWIIASTPLQWPYHSREGRFFFWDLKTFKNAANGHLRIALKVDKKVWISTVGHTHLHPSFSGTGLLVLTNTWRIRWEQFISLLYGFCFSFISEKTRREGVKTWRFTHVEEDKKIMQFNFNWYFDFTDDTNHSQFKKVFKQRL